jgi:hypothetical protein
MWQNTTGTVKLSDNALCDIFWHLNLLNIHVEGFLSSLWVNSKRFIIVFNNINELLKCITNIQANQPGQNKFGCGRGQCQSQ